MNRVDKAKKKLAKPKEAPNLTTLRVVDASDIQELNKSVQELKIALIEDLERVKAPDYSTLYDTLEAFLEKLQEFEPQYEAITKSIEKIQLNAPEVNVKPPDIKFAPIIQKQTDDIYARYDFTNSNTEPDGTYVGYLNQTGNWFIQLITKNITTGEQTIKFTVGSKNYKQSWQRKRGLTYKLRSEVVIP